MMKEIIKVLNTEVLRSNFLIIGLCSSFANSRYEILSFLIPPPRADFLSKKL